MSPNLNHELQGMQISDWAQLQACAAVIMKLMLWQFIKTGLLSSYPHHRSLLTDTSLLKVAGLVD